MAAAKVIHFGGLVTASVSNDSFSVSVPAKAKGSGSVGDIIPVELLNSKKKVMARVVSAKIVEVQ